jgi:hypothetical protein
MHGWMKILKISIDFASLHPFSKVNFIRKGHVIIIQIRKPKGIGETSEEELKELTDVLVNNYG